MSASWASALIALAVLLGIIAGRVWNLGRRDGRIDAVLEQLAKTDDHLAGLIDDLDDRVRFLEHRPARRRR